MKIPKKINVFGTTYKVKFVDTDMFMGLCDYQKKTIFLSVNQTKEQLIDTYVHECIHALQFTLAYHQFMSRGEMEFMAEHTAMLIKDMLKVK